MLQGCLQTYNGAAHLGLVQRRKMFEKKGPARSRRVFFIGGIEEVFLVGARLDWRSVRKPEVWLTTRIVATRKAQLLIYVKNWNGEL